MTEIMSQSYIEFVEKLLIDAGLHKSLIPDWDELIVFFLRRNLVVRCSTPERPPTLKEPKPPMVVTEKHIAFSTKLSIGRGIQNSFWCRQELEFSRETGIFKWVLIQPVSELWVEYTHLSKNVEARLVRKDILFKMEACEKSRKNRREMCIGATLSLGVKDLTRASLELKKGSITMLIGRMHKAQVQEHPANQRQQHEQQQQQQQQQRLLQEQQQNRKRQQEKYQVQETYCQTKRMKTLNCDTLSGCKEHTQQLKESSDFVALKQFRRDLMLKWHSDKRFDDTTEMKEFAKTMLAYAMSIEIS